MIIYENCGVIKMERSVYKNDLEEIDKYSSSLIPMITSLCHLFSVISQLDIFDLNIKTSNIKYNVEKNSCEICDLFLNNMRNKSDYSLYDINFMSPEQIEDKEVNESSEIWSLCCIIYELFTTNLPFNKNESKKQTINNILKCQYKSELIKNPIILLILQNVFILNVESRMTMKELMNEIELLDVNAFKLKIDIEKMEILGKDIEIIKICNIFPKEYYMYSPIYEDISRILLLEYNNNYNKWHLSMLWWISKLHNILHIEHLVEYNIKHCHKNNKECYLDQLLFNIKYEINNDAVIIDDSCYCGCEEGIEYLCEMLKEIGVSRIKFNIRLVINNQRIFKNSFVYLDNIKEINLSNCNIHHQFIELLSESLPLMNNMLHLNIKSISIINIYSLSLFY